METMIHVIIGGFLGWFGYSFGYATGVHGFESKITKRWRNTAFTLVVISLFMIAVSSSFAQSDWGTQRANTWRTGSLTDNSNGDITYIQFTKWADINLAETIVSIWTHAADIITSNPAGGTSFIKDFTGNFGFGFQHDGNPPLMHGNKLILGASGQDAFLYANNQGASLSYDAAPSAGWTLSDQLTIDNLNINGNTFSTTTGDVNISPTLMANTDFQFGGIELGGTEVFTDARVIQSITQLNVDNLRLDGNTISSTDTNGPIVLSPDGTGNIGMFEANPDADLEIAGNEIHLDGTTAASIEIDRGNTNSPGLLKFKTADSTNWVVGSPDSDDLGDGSEFLIAVNDLFTTPALWIETNGDVGLGTTTPEAKVHIQTGDSGLAPNTRADDLFLEGAARVGISMISDSLPDDVQIFFGNSDVAINDDDYGAVTYFFDATPPHLAFKSGAAYRLYITDAGDIGILTPTPTAALDVNGDVNIVTTLDVGGITTLGGLLDVNAGAEFSLGVDVNTTMSVEDKFTVEDDLIFTSAGSGLAFAEMWVGDSVATITVDSDDPDTTVTQFTTNGLSNNCTPNVANNRIDIDVAGVYMVKISLSAHLGSGVETELHIHAFLNDVEQDQVAAEVTIDTGAVNFQTMSASGFIDAAAGSRLDVRAIIDHTTARSATFVHVNMSVFQVGGT